MSATGVGRGSPSKPKSSPKEKRKEPQNSGIVDRLKAVVRRLPPNLPEDVFWQSVENWVTDDSVTWKVFYQGKLRKKLNKENVPSRAYIAFKNEEELAVFSHEYDGHLFRDKAGNESQAVVEFAPYQKIPSEKKKPDARNATIDTDEDYISFVESLKPVPTNTEPVSLETLIAATQPPSPPKTTPLLEALKAQKSAQKEKEAIIRNHAHYKEVASIAVSSGTKKEDGKKKAAVPPVQKQTEPAPSSKKAAKRAAAAQRASAAAAAATTNQTPSTMNAGTSQTVPPAPAPKASRGRQRQAKMSAPASVSVNPDSSVPATQVAEATAPQSSSPASTSRRGRPVIGLASRQFEAALTGAGVAGAGERKPRPEREREKGKDDEGAMQAPSTGKEPGKGRKRKEDRAGIKGGGPVPTAGEPGSHAASSLARSDVAPPVIQRDAQLLPPRILARPPDAQGVGGVVPPVPVESTGGQGRGRRGRGRGRGIRGGG